MSWHVKQMVPNEISADTDLDSKPGDGTDRVDGTESADSARVWDA